MEVLYTGCFHTAPMNSLRTGSGIFHHQAPGNGHVQHLGHFQRNLGIRLGMSDVVAVGYSIEIVAQANLPENERCVFEGGTDGGARSLSSVP